MQIIKTGGEGNRALISSSCAGCPHSIKSANYPASPTRAPADRTQWGGSSPGRRARCVKRRRKRPRRRDEMAVFERRAVTHRSSRSHAACYFSWLPRPHPLVRPVARRPEIGLWLERCRRCRDRRRSTPLMATAGAGAGPPGRLFLLFFGARALGASFASGQLIPGCHRDIAAGTPIPLRASPTPRRFPVIAAIRSAEARTRIHAHLESPDQGGQPSHTEYGHPRAN